MMRRWFPRVTYLTKKEKKHFQNKAKTLLTTMRTSSISSAILAVIMAFSTISLSEVLAFQSLHRYPFTSTCISLKPKQSPYQKHLLYKLKGGDYLDSLGEGSGETVEKKISVSASGMGTASIPNEIFNLVKSIVGAGVLSLPAGKFLYVVMAYILLSYDFVSEV